MGLMGETRRDSLISAAAQLLDEGGLAAVTLREVGRVAGVSRNAPYKHFEDKTDLLASIAGRELRRQTANAAALSGDPASAPTPEALMLEYVRSAQQYPERFKLTFGRWTKANAEFNGAALEARRLWFASVVTAQASGELPRGDPQQLTALVLALAHGAADLALSGHLSATGRGRSDPQDLVKALFRHLRASAGSESLAG